MFLGRWEKIIYWSWEFVNLFLSWKTSEELVSRRKYLQGREEMRQYEKMVGDTFKINPTKTDVASALMTMQNQVSIILNVIVSVAAMFGIFYYIGMQYSKVQSTVSVKIHTF